MTSGTSPVIHEEAESFLDYIDLIARFTKQGHLRWLLVRGDPPRILAETIWPWIGFGFSSPVPKAVAAGLDLEAVATWEAAPHRYFTASRDDLWYVHTCVDDDDELVSWLEDALDVALAGRAPVRTRDEQLAKGGRFVQALNAWEADDDSPHAERAMTWARSWQSTGPDRRAKLRWGMLPIEES